MGASLVGVMIKGVKEAVAAFRNAQTAQITVDRRLSPISARDQSVRQAAADNPAFRDSDTYLDDDALGTAIVALAYLVDVKDPTVVNMILKAVPALSPSEARWELFCLRAFAGLTAIRSVCAEGARCERVIEAFYAGAWATIPSAGWSGHGSHLLPRIETYIYAFSTARTSADGQDFEIAELVGSELMMCCHTSDSALVETGATAFLTTFESAARIIEESKVGRVA
jgi:hypothetical protein